MKGINAGSGQRPFTSVDGMEWVNLDIQERWKPDVVGDWTKLTDYFEYDTIDIIVSHHSFEHTGAEEGDKFIFDSEGVLKPGGSLIIIVPDMRALAQRWLLKQMDTDLYMTNVYGAYMGHESDRHKRGFDGESLWRCLKKFKFKDVHAFNWRTIPGADIAGKDWWFMGIEAIK